MNTNNHTYIASVSSWYHMLGVTSYFYGNQKKAKKLIIIVGSFFGFTPFANKEFFNNCADEIIILKSLEKLKSLALPVNNKYTIISTSPYPYNVSQALKSKKLNFNLIIIEEGIGTYGGYKQRIQAICRESSSPKKTDKAKLVLRDSISLLIKKIIFKKTKKEYWLNFDKKNLDINNNVVIGYQTAIEKIKKNNTDLDLKKSIIIITSPFVELGLVDSDKYINYIKSLTKKTNRNIYIKPHPIENKNKYESIGIVIDPSTPIEMILCNYPKETILYSFSSTSLYTAKLFFNLNVIRLNEFDLFYNLLGKNQKKIIDSMSKKTTH